MQNAWWEKQGNTWWVKCNCTKSFPASEQIIRHPTVKLRCPYCSAEFNAKDAVELYDPLET